MTGFSIPLYRPDGRIRGTFVYLVLCEEGSSIFIKIGVSDEPIKRLRELATGCPLEPGILAYVEFPNRAGAFRVERLLHSRFLAWRSRGEWFRFHQRDKPQFNAGLREVLADWQRPSSPMKWTKVNADELLRKITVARLHAEAKKARLGLRRAKSDLIAAQFNPFSKS